MQGVKEFGGGQGGCAALAREERGWGTSGVRVRCGFLRQGCGRVLLCGQVENGVGFVESRFRDVFGGEMEWGVEGTMGRPVRPPCLGDERAVSRWGFWGLGFYVPHLRFWILVEGCTMKQLSVFHVVLNLATCPFQFDSSLHPFRPNPEFRILKEILSHRRPLPIYIFPDYLSVHHDEQHLCPCDGTSHATDCLSNPSQYAS